jgi:DNA polymerase
LRVPRHFPELARLVICHAEPGRFALLFRLLRRLQDQPRLLDILSDPDVHRAESMARAVRRERHKMHAFVRFREVKDPEGLRFIAWFEPAHHVVRLASPFFVERFARMRWSILTPELCVHWDCAELSFGPGADKSDAPSNDRLEETWRTYYASIFNPARVKIGAMKREMPMRFWQNLPESSLIAPLIQAAGNRERTLIEQPAAPVPLRAPRILSRLEDARRIEPLPEGSLPALRREVDACRRCPLWEPATQAVFGEGASHARILVVGEQPGDREDIEGRPFVGPAGALFDRALAAAGIDRRMLYLTNAVKHFKYAPRGKRRLHKSPNTMEIQACSHWLQQEVAHIHPQLTIALGGSALRSLTGESLPVQRLRGTIVQSPFAGPVFATVHPSFILRLPDEAAKQAEFERFVADLAQAAGLLAAAE